MITKIFICNLLFVSVLFSCYSRGAADAIKEPSNIAKKESDSIEGKYRVRTYDSTYDLNLKRVDSNLFFFTLYSNALHPQILDNSCGILKLQNDTLEVLTGGFGRKRNFYFLISPNNQIKICFIDTNYVRGFNIALIDKPFTKISISPDLDLRRIIFSYRDILSAKVIKNGELSLYEYPALNSKKTNTEVSVKDSIYTTIYLANWNIDNIGVPPANYIKLFHGGNCYYGWIFMNESNKDMLKLNVTKQWKDSEVNVIHNEYRKISISEDKW